MSREVYRRMALHRQGLEQGPRAVVRDGMKVAELEDALRRKQRKRQPPRQPGVNRE